MEAQFWHERWDQQQIGFHQPGGHPMLPAYWPQLGLGADARVLVPLCGKTPDLLWLAERGHAVTGIELSRRAAVDFFDEHGLDCTVAPVGSFERHQARYGAGHIEILVGDFFAADSATLGVFDAFYDRAALIALPSDLRADYVAHLHGLLGANAPGLLITLDYDQNTMKGPPFAVPDSEVRSHFEPIAGIQRLHSSDNLAGQGMLERRRVPAAYEYVYQLRSRAAAA